MTGSTVWGATRAYRWECLQQVLPLEERLGWDGIDEFKANCARLAHRDAEGASVPASPPRGRARRRSVPGACRAGSVGVVHGLPAVVSGAPRAPQRPPGSSCARPALGICRRRACARRTDRRSRGARRTCEASRAFVICAARLRESQRRLSDEPRVSSVRRFRLEPVDSGAERDEDEEHERHLDERERVVGEHADGERGDRRGERGEEPASIASDRASRPSRSGARNERTARATQQRRARRSRAVSTATGCRESWRVPPWFSATRVPYPWPRNGCALSSCDRRRDVGETAAADPAGIHLLLGDEATLGEERALQRAERAREENVDDDEDRQQRRPEAPHLAVGEARHTRRRRRPASEWRCARRSRSRRSMSMPTQISQRRLIVRRTR